MLDEHWSRHPDLQHIKVYQASGVARKALSVFQTYVGMMNSAIQEAVQVRLCGRAVQPHKQAGKGWKWRAAACQSGALTDWQVLFRTSATFAYHICNKFLKQEIMKTKRADVLHVLSPFCCCLSLLQYRNPFQFKHVAVLGAGMQFQDVEPCVMLATPSMLQSGFSRELFEAWAGDKCNTVLIVDFAVQGTLARQLLDSPQTVTTKDNRPVGGGGGGLDAWQVLVFTCASCVGLEWRASTVPAVLHYCLVCASAVGAIGVGTTAVCAPVTQHSMSARAVLQKSTTQQNSSM